jgi:hypothetical protein
VNPRRPRAALARAAMVVTMFVCIGAVARVAAQSPSVVPAARAAFDAVSALLATITLNDHENGEVLGTLLDLIEGVEADGTSGGGTAATRLQVTLAPGAADRLRRSAEFERRGDAFVRALPVEVRVRVAADRTRAVIEVAPRP